MEISLKGRAALITGGSKGLGLAIATRFARSGGDVAILARDAAGLEAARQQLATLGGRVAAVSCDVADADGVRRGWDAAVAELGKIDILVNNAGTSQTGKFTEITDAVWQADLDLKLFAAIRLSRLAWPGMQERRWGRIINVLNLGAKAPRPGGAPTAVSRAAGMALMKVLSGEGAPHNILVNGLLVGKIESDQWVRRHAKQAGGGSLQDYYREMGKDLPMGRVGTAEEFANIACFLASDAASYISGSAINVDGATSPVV